MNSNLAVNSETGGPDGMESHPVRASVIGPAEEAAGDDGANNDEGGVVGGISMEELIYGASSFHAIVKPVSATMILAAVAVSYVNTEETKASGEVALDQTYQVFTLSDDQSAATNLGLGLVNALVIVSVITGMTFLIVLLYKYKCMKLLIGYMMFASAMLLGFLGGLMFKVLIDKYQLTIDQISFYITMYNFAIVGVVAVFYQKGIPTYINQSYLVATSVIVAWQLSYFNDWMAWTLLIMLALYDLFAVLSPCGPLRALVNLMSKDDAPAMPGLLYEARLPENATRPGRQRSKRSDDIVRNQGGTDEQSPHISSTDNNNPTANNDNGEPVLMLRGGGHGDDGDGDDVISTGRDVFTREKSLSRQNSAPSPRRKCSNLQNEGESSENGVSMLATDALSGSSSPIVTVPLAIAKCYKLPLVSTSLVGITSLDTSTPTAYLQQDHQFTALELQTNVEVILPRNGGRIKTTRNKKGKPRYVIYSREGQVKRTLLVDDNGCVMEIVSDDDVDTLDSSDNTIKLGLGDFIFYSVLVSKAAEHGFAAFVACFLSVLAGLGGTLVLLAVFHHALPALPISIFIAVIMFVLTYFCMEPWIEDMWSGPFYV
ncbi:hypothetical protein ACHAXA_001366 [Cyclostephanos tholiformis]|uniref:Presenilin n=1 Tax=Cyclostephanos tholiformis TaxID=382380 RepID=A0ABD3RKS3_9STRA